jgi:hypothetical protein
VTVPADPITLLGVVCRLKSRSSMGNPHGPGYTALTFGADYPQLNDEHRTGTPDLNLHMVLPHSVADQFDTGQSYTLTFTPDRTPAHVPYWAVQLTQLVRQVLANQAKIITSIGAQVALTDDLKAAITALTSEVTALVTEDGIVVTALTDLLAKAQQQGGSVSDTDVQGALTAVQEATASIQAQVAQVDAAVQADDPGAEPQPTPAPAGP